MKRTHLLQLTALSLSVLTVLSGCGAAGASIYMNNGEVVNIGDATVQVPEDPEAADGASSDKTQGTPAAAGTDAQGTDAAPQNADGTDPASSSDPNAVGSSGTDPYITGGGISPYYKPDGTDTTGSDSGLPTITDPATNPDQIWSENRGDTSTLGNTAVGTSPYTSTSSQTTTETAAPVRLDYDVYVATTGDDYSGTGTYDNPFRTIQKGLDSVSANHKVYLLSGIYEGANKFTASGSGKGPITVTTYPGNSATVQLAPGESGAIFDINGQSNITISNLRIGYSYAPWVYGVFMSGGESDITVENCEICNISTTAAPGGGGAYAVLAYGKGATDTKAIRNVTIYDNNIHDIYTGLSEGIAASGNVDSIYVDGNTIYEISNIGIDLIGGIGYSEDQALDHPRNCQISGNTVYHCVSPFAACAAIYVSGCRDCVITDNYVYENAYGIEVADENYNMYYPTTNISVDGNTVHNNHDSGITIGGVNPITSGYVTNSKLTRNILYNNGMYINDGANGEIHFEKCDNIDVSDNIVRNHDYKNAVIGCTLTSEYVKNVKFNNNLYAYDKPEKIVFKFQGNDYIGLENWNKFTGGKDISAPKAAGSTK